MKNRVSRPVPVLILASSILSWAAIFNGYPFVWPDTGGYVQYTNLFFRPPFYSLLLYPMHLTWSLWPVVFWQSLIIVHLLYLIVRTTFAPFPLWQFLFIVILLATLSSLPWITAFIMADVFAPILVLSMFLIGFSRNQLGKTERIYLHCLVLAAVTVHSSHIPLAVGLLGFICVARFLFRNLNRVYGHRCWSLTATVSMAMAVVLANNYYVHNCASLAPGGYAFLLVRLAADGPAIAYLQKNCPHKGYAICPYLQEVPDTTEDFLWNLDSPFRKLGWFRGYRKEGQEIVWGTIREYPIWTTKTALKNTYEQLLKFQAGQGLISYLNEEYPTKDIKRRFPGDYRYYERSRQSNGKLYLKTVNQFHNIALSISLAFSLAVTLLFMKRGNWPLVLLFIMIGVSVLLNSSTTGPLSEPAHRYLSRLIWLIPFYSFTSALHILVQSARKTSAKGNMSVRS